MFFLSRIENNLQAGTLSVNIYETGYYLTTKYFFIAQNNYLTEKKLYTCIIMTNTFHLIKKVDETSCKQILHVVMVLLLSNVFYTSLS